MALMNTNVVNYYCENHKQSLQDGTDKSYPNINLVRIVNKFFDKKPGHVLDYGAGFGANLIFLLKQGYTVDALDTSPYALEVIKKKISSDERLTEKVGLTHLSEESISIPFMDDTFDYVVCASVLSLLSTEENIRHLLSEFVRVLRYNGKLYLDINGPDSEFVIYSEKIGKHQYLYRGRDQLGPPRQVYCPQRIEDFINLVSDFFEVVESGYTKHRYFNYAEHEFILCAQNVMK